MSADTIILLIGGLFILLAIVDSLSFNGSSLGLINIKLRVPIGILGILLLMYGGYSYGMINPQAQIEQADRGNKLTIDFPIENVKLISPIEGDAVKCRTLSMGVYPDAHEKDLWVLLKPSDGKYYPQSDHTNTSYKRNGEWQVITRFGGDKGEAYDIIVYETDAAASEFFSATILDWKSVNSFPGLQLADIPAGANEVDRIKISLQENCRGVF
ncbi:MAG: hypothetical protein R8P61_36860 [Bacteroidia bacterium]|nr:hypothetical protein [Bacteroidia bacterium]